MALGEALKYHVVSGTYTSTDLMVNELMLESLAGTKIRVNYYRSMGVSTDSYIYLVWYTPL